MLVYQRYMFFDACRWDAYSILYLSFIFGNFKDVRYLSVPQHVHPNLKLHCPSTSQVWLVNLPFFSDVHSISFTCSALDDSFESCELDCHPDCSLSRGHKRKKHPFICSSIPVLVTPLTHGLKLTNAASIHWVIYIYVYIYMVSCSVFLPPPPPQWYGSPGSTPFPSICKL